MGGDFTGDENLFAVSRNSPGYNFLRVATGVHLGRIDETHTQLQAQL
jgi:hypothetical protein